jgi:hypothetical protein
MTADVLDFETRGRLDAAQIIWNATHRPNSPDGKAVASSARAVRERAEREARVKARAAALDPMAGRLCPPPPGAHERAMFNRALYKQREREIAAKGQATRRANLKMRAEFAEKIAAVEALCDRLRERVEKFEQRDAQLLHSPGAQPPGGYGGAAFPPPGAVAGPGGDPGPVSPLEVDP